MTNRTDILKLVEARSTIVELGVAQGELSESLLGTGLVGHLYSIDAWAGDRRHDDRQYAQALKRLEPYKDINTVMRMTFNQALNHFEDESIDLLYVDGYAHTGMNGDTVRNWYPKVKPGGIVSGDDYSMKFPLNVRAIDQFVKDYELEFNLLECADPNSRWGRYNSWWARKPQETLRES